MVKVLTVNVRGMRKKWTRTSIFRELRKLKTDICLLQECHVTKNDVDIWTNEWKGQLFYNECTNRSQGEIILISKNLQCDNVQYIHRSEGLLAISFEIEGEKYIMYVCICPKQ